jgi:hypothetical protein
MVLAESWQRASEDNCPVPEQLLGTIHRATPAEAMALARLLPDAQRAKLALFCYKRSHLRDSGLAIAVACTDGDLVKYGGVSGQALIVQRRLPSDGPAFKPRANVTLSTPALQHLFVTGDDAHHADEDAA